MKTSCKNKSSQCNLLLTKINLHALESFDRVCDKKGLHMATYLKEEEEEAMKYGKFLIKTRGCT